MQVLHSVASAITEGAEGTGNAKGASLVANGIRQSGTGMLYSPYTDKPFAVPTPFNPRAMLEKAQARLDFVLDGLELMQTEPAFMQSLLRSMKADINTGGNTIRPDVMWGRNGLNIMSDMINSINAWTSLCTALRDVCECLEKREVPISPGEVVDRATSKAMDELCCWLDHHMRVQSYVLNGIMPGTRTLRNDYVAHESAGVMTFTQTRAGHGSAVKFVVDAIRQSIFKSSSHDMLSMFKTLLMVLCDSRTSELADKRLYEQLSELMLMSELWSDQNFSQYVRTEWREAQGDSPSYNKNGLSEHANKTLTRPGADTIDRIGKAIKHFMEVPWPQGRKNTTWFLKAAECRTRLASLWERMRQEIIRVEKAAGKPSLDKFIARIQFDSAPEYLARIEQERQHCDARTAADSATVVARRTTNKGPEPDSWTVGEEIRPIQRKQTKAKAARLASHSANNDKLSEQFDKLALDIETTKASQPNIELQPIAVKHETLILFNKMFPGGNGAETKSDVRWDVFVQAMADAGFVTTDASGSAVSFSDGHQGRIVFHRPHPDPTVDRIMLHAMGRRLGKWFGWSAERFVLREKNEE